MDKILVERPRHGGGRKYPRPSRELCDESVQDRLRSREGMKAVWRDRPKSLNENLAPLRRFLHAAVGRVWDDVYSEIRGRIAVDSAVQEHILTHLWQFVEVHVIEINGTVCYGTGYWMGQPLRSYRFGQLFVCPRTGILKRLPPKARKKAQTCRNVVVLGPDTQARRVDGIWYKFCLAGLPKSGGVWDCFVNRMVWLGDASVQRKVYGVARYAACRQQLSRRDIQRIVAALEGR